MNVVAAALSNARSVRAQSSGDVPFVDGPVRGDALFRVIEAPILRLEALLGRALPNAVNPLVWLGALANLALLVAVGSGIPLLLWYQATTTGAYASVVDMQAQPLLGGLVRGVHRYSSDAAVLLVGLHALRMFAARRITGARWIAWVTGFALCALLVFVGWLGYWLVWDQAAQQIASATARLVERLPLFASPLSRSFLADDLVDSRLFFVVFFLHMLLPTGIALVVWLHVARVARARFLPGRALTLWCVASFVALAVLLPAPLGGPAKMAEVPPAFPLDVWFGFALPLLERASTGVAWAISFVGGAVLLSLPWTLAKTKIRAATVDTSSCNACERCVRDCPYDAISMVPRTDGRAHAAQASVDPARCLGCGVCAGSCDSAAIGIDWFKTWDVRRTVEARAPAANHLAFVCAESAGGALTIDPASGACDAMPGWQVEAVPCAGWVHALTIERALKRGVERVLVVSCGPGECRFREGAQTIDERISGARTPALRILGQRERVTRIAIDRGDPRALARTAARLRAGEAVVPPARRRFVAPAAGAAIAVAAALVVGLASDVPYTTAEPDAPMLVFSFEHPGRQGDGCRTLGEEEKAKLPVHMRVDRICDRGRSPVVARIVVDGDVVLQRSYAATGVWGDGHSVAIERIPVAPGAHHVSVLMDDDGDDAAWAYTAESDVTFATATRRVLLFRREEGFTWR